MCVYLGEVYSRQREQQILRTEAGVCLASKEFRMKPIPDLELIIYSLCVSILSL